MKKLKNDGVLQKVRERISRGDLEEGWQLEVLDRTVPEQCDSWASFHRKWVQPLLDAGLSREAALALLVELQTMPN